MAVGTAVEFGVEGESGGGECEGFGPFGAFRGEEAMSEFAAQAVAGAHNLE